MTVALVGTAGRAGAQSAAPGSYRLELAAGGPYRGSVGKPLALAGSAGIAGQRKTVSDLQAIGAALVRYRQEHGSYPPSAIADATGKPLLSWRVLLLPYLGQGSLYERFDLTKPWDDPANKRLLTQMPAVYRAGDGRRGTNTGYAGVGGSKAIFRGPGATLEAGVPAAAVSDGPQMTVAAGPVGVGVAIPWTAPGDITATDSTHFGDRTGFDGPGASITPMLFADGSVQLLPDTISSGSIHGWTTIASGGCTPPSGLAVSVAPAWDLDGDGTFETTGSAPTFTPTRAGTSTIRFRGIDSTGRPVVRTARLVIR